MKIYSRIEDVPEEFLEHLNKMQWSDGREPTDEEKLETLNNLSAFLENIMDMWYGTGTYSRPDYDAAEFRRKQNERHAKEDKMTPQEFYDEAYADFMNRYGQSNIKRFGAEATEEKARAWATSSMERAIQTRQMWHDLKAKKDAEKSVKQKKPRKPRKKTMSEA